MNAETIFWIIIGVVLFVVILLWISAIDYMKEHHPDYKGEDLFGEEDDDEIESFYNQMDKEVHQNNGNLNK